MKLRIKSSARVKRHYLLLEAKNKKEVEQTILDYIGILGWAKASPKWITKGKKLILAIERKSITNVRASFELSSEKIKVLKVSGTLKGLKIK
jgi:RNase P/RNase MRP subunit POP5